MLTQRFTRASSDELLSRDDTLVVMPLTAQCAPSVSGVIHSGIEDLSPDQLNEVWTVNGQVARGQTGDNYWSKTEDMICVARWLTKAQCEQMEESVFEAYLSIFSVLKSHGFEHPFRFWNYLPNINTGDGDEEIYKRFCTGRLQAFEQLGIAASSFPSASALGHHTDGAVIYVFASAEVPQHLKNDKQVNAFNYPRQYGISSPSFTRATALTLADTPYLFISGTASIIGHKTVEVGHLQRQLGVTLDNIEHLLATANPQNRQLATFKVYLRHPEHLAPARDWLNQRYPDVETVFTLADICRSDLLVEIECFCH
ncbi:chorismate transformation enzyme, FkbO/Hyg5 family [Alteromonas halophila]|uniref:Pteridine-dependent deoxygenase like protein n=1 Tax=Alteromonas halophila TaxID=516698 RepID=A0A918JJT6_9ALTE|nr:dioxygenase [Alteromonas halophila]GGW84992.1 pteridine-dependent deoxygenase like protein [Alteromonas halophila]